MSFSKTPSVFGFVSISAATSSVDLRFKRGEIDLAFGVGLQVLDRVSGMAAVAGLVPCAESGMRIFLRGLPFDSR